MTHEADHSRYVITVDGEQAGFTSYRLFDDVLVFQHTVIPDRFAGKGYAGALVDQALGDVAAGGGRFAATCPYIVHWLTKHHQHDAALVPVP